MALRQSCGNSAGGLSQVSISGCLTGAGTLLSPLTISIDPTGLLTCGVGGLRLANAPTGVGGGITFVTVTGCVSGSGVPGSPLTIVLNPTGGLNCTLSGLALQQSYMTQVITSGCFDGIGLVGSPLLLKINPTGLIQCTSNGIAFNGPTGLIFNGVQTLGCVSGNGITVPLQLVINPTGRINCTPAGLALQEVYLTQVITSGCIEGIGTAGSPILLKINPTGLIHCTPNGIAYNGPTGVGGGTPAAPFNSVQFNNAGSFGGSSGLMWTGSGLIISSLTQETGVLFSVGRAEDATPLFETNHYADFISARYATVRGEGLYLAQDSTSNRLGLMGQFGMRLASTLSYGFSDSSSGISNLDVTIYRDATDTLALRRLTNAQKFSVYKTYTNLTNFERGTLDWQGSPGVFRIGTEQQGTGAATPVAIMTSGVHRIDVSAVGNIQFNSAYTFPTGVGASGHTLVNNGAGFLEWGTPYIITSGCLIGSGTLASPAQVKLDPTGLLACGPDGLRYIGPTGGVAGLPAAPNTSIQFNDGGLFGGSSRLTWDGTTVSLSGNINVSGSTLTSDAADNLAQRRSSNAQKFSVYKTYTSNSNFERGVLDWQGSPGVFRVGTEQQGAGAANPVAIMTSGVHRIDISAVGNVQFNSAYTFPTGVGANGQTLVNNGAGTLSWGTPLSYATGCMTGSGTVTTPFQVLINPTGLLHCTPLGLAYNGPTGLGGGSPASPDTSIQFNNGGNFGGSSRLTWDGTTVALSGNINVSGTTLASDAADSLAQRRSTNAQKFSIYNTYTNSTNYGRGVLDWQGSPGVFRMGTEQQGTGAATPVAIMTSGVHRIDVSALGNIQFNSAYTFPTGVGANGQTLVNNGAGSLSWGTPLSYATGCLTGSGTITTPFQVLINPTGYLHCTPLGLAYNGPTGLGGGTPGAPLTSIQFNNGGNFGGSSSLTWDGSTVGLSGSINISGSTLTSDALDTLAQRRSTNAQKFSIYNTYTTSTNYERGVLDFKGSPGTFRIGTEQQGAGLANPVAIMTSGVHRIDIAALGNIQFNSAYTFPTGVGASGQTFVNNGAGTLSWGLPNVRATGCLTGSGTVASPLQILINPTGLLHCTPAGLAYNGPTGIGTNGLLYVVATGCISGSGTTESPIQVALNPTGGISCGANGLYLSNSGLTYITTSTCLAGSGTAASPARILLNSTGLINCTANGLAFAGPTGIIMNGVSTQGCITGNGKDTPLSISLNSTGLIQCTPGGLAFNGPTGILFNGVQTLGCISGNGTTTPVQLKLDPTGLLTCGSAGLRLSNAPSAGSTSLTLDLTGSGTHADPTTAVDLVYNNGTTTNTIDFRPLIYFNMGQVGPLVADGSIDNQPRFIVPEGFQIEICRAYLTIGNPGSDTTTVQLQRYVATTDCTEPGTNGTPFSKDVFSGCTWQRWDEVEGLTLGSLTHLTFRVLTPGPDAENIVAHFWARVTVCFEP